MGWELIPSTPRMQTDNREVNQLQSNILSTLNQITANPLTSGVLVQSIVLVAASNPNQISHTLGRTLIGWIITRRTANSIQWDSQNSNTIANGYAGPENTLLLNTSANVTVDIFCF